MVFTNLCYNFTMNPSSGRPNSGQNFNQGMQPRPREVLRSTPFNNQSVGNLATKNVNQNLTVPNRTAEMLPASPERQLSNPEQRTGSAMGAGQTTARPAASSQQVAVVSSTPTISSGTSIIAPVTASDNDKIEREWVTASQKVIATTRDDPYAQASAIADLMRDYVRKRYGKEVGKASDS